MAIHKAEHGIPIQKLTANATIILLHGDEPYFLNLVGEHLLKNSIPEHEKGFNEQILYGKDVTVGAVISNARRYPMMADKQLVYVKEANEIQDIGQKENQELLQRYIENPLDSTILVLHFTKSPDARKSWMKFAEKNATVFVSKKMYDNKIPSFIQEFCQSENLKISPKASELLFEHTGNDLEKITKEIKKLELNLSESRLIDAELIEKYVGISKDFNVFELQNAIGKKNKAKCFQIFNYFASSPKDHPIQPVITMVFNYFLKIIQVHVSHNTDEKILAGKLNVHPFFVKEYTAAARNYSLSHCMLMINALRKADAKSKGIGEGATEMSIYQDLLLSL